MRRREFILGVGEVSILAALPVARAQDAGRRYRIAILTNTPREVGLPPAFRAELGHGGFVEGGNLDVDYRGFGVAPSSLEAVAIELTRARRDVIFATGPEAARATQRATTSVAIVALANDLVAQWPGNGAGGPSSTKHTIWISREERLVLPEETNVTPTWFRAIAVT
jgi:putative ABC transport system substrate-binding protein